MLWHYKKRNETKQNSLTLTSSPLVATQSEFYLSYRISCVKEHPRGDEHTGFFLAYKSILEVITGAPADTLY